MAKTKNHSADCKAYTALEAARSEAMLAQLATKYGIHLKAWTIRTTK